MSITVKKRTRPKGENPEGDWRSEEQTLENNGQFDEIYLLEEMKRKGESVDE